MSKVFFLDQIRDLVVSGAAPDRAAVEHAEACARREAYLRDAEPAITSEDTALIVQGALKPFQALKVARAFHDTARGVRAASDGRPMCFLALLGEPGRGKTVAACALLAEVGGRYTSAPELGRMRSSSHWRDRDAFKALYTSRLLLIDDVGAESGGAMEEALFDLVNARQVGRAITVMTGNLTRSEFAERYGVRTVSRIEHQGAIVEIKGDDLRRGAL